jgi:DNA-binding CsgD family transcriptional regulator
MTITPLQKRSKFASFAFKLNRIRKQEQFRKTYNDSFLSLTNREKEILQCLSEGYNNPQIGEKLFISRRTVEQHRKNINRKLKVKSYADLLRYALAFNLV